MPFGPTGSVVSKLRDDTSDDEETPGYGDPFYTEIQSTMRYIFGGVLKPNTLEGQNMMTPWIDLYKTKQSSFHVKGSIHQNGMKDDLHLSVTYSSYLAPDVKFHIYGHYRGRFIIDRVTMLAGTRVIELATYSREL